MAIYSLMGSTTQINAATLSIEDRTIELGRVAGGAPSESTSWDLGILFNYNDESTPKKSAVAAGNLSVEELYLEKM